MSQEIAHGHESDVATEADRTRSGVIALVAGAISLTILALLAILNGVMTRVIDAEISRKTLEPESSALRALRAGESERLSRYQWVDRQAGVVRLPIERASEIVLARYTESAPELETGVRK